jgi:hypothetical protein
MATADFFLGIADALLDVVRPLEQAVQTADGFESLLLRFGWHTPNDQAYIAEVQSIFGLTADIEGVVQLIETVVEKDDFSIEDAIKVLQLAVDVIQKIGALATSPPANALPPPLNDPRFWPSFAEDLVQDLFAEYLQVFQPAVYAPLHLLGIVDEELVPAKGAPGRIDYVRYVVRWDRLGKMFTDPGALVADVYGWGGTFLHDNFVRRIQRVMVTLGLPASLYRPQHALAGDYYAENNPSLFSVHELRAPLFIDSDTAVGYAEIGLALLPIPPAGDKNSAPVGFLVGPYLHGGATEDIPLGGPMVLRLHGGLDADAPVGLEIRPSGAGVRLSLASTTIDAGMALLANPPQPWILLGTPNSHRLELSDFRIGIDVTGTVNDPDIKLAVATSKLAVVVQFEDGDGFLNKIFGTNPETFFVDGTLSWSTKTGLAFSGDAGIALAININLNLGDVIQIPTLYILVDVATGGKVQLIVAVDAKAEIGPISGSVEKLGIRLVLTEKAKGQPAGTFGDLDVGFGFKPPIGVGVELDAGPVTGGGFIEFDEDNARYAGVLALSLYGISVKAIGLLDTRLPGGEAGYSFLIIISVEFTPIQLGFGFTLNGVGGLCGINRTIVTATLQAGVRNHAVDHILFPKDPVRNAPQIISDLRAIFPPAEGRYVFGPMLELGWGGGLNLVTAELGFILEVPMPIRIVILGQLNVNLPNPDAAVVELHLDVVGIIDFGKKFFSLDASLHDSRIVIFVIYGDMAMRLVWGDNPSFALSIGGLNPHFQPPPGFPTLRPLTIALSTSDAFHLSIQSYFAITSNSFQFGAHAELYIGVGSLNVYGWLGFDTLFIFQPFSFIVDFTAGLALRSGDQTLLGISVSGELSGATPWHAKGDAHVTIIFFEISVSFDTTWGEEKKNALPDIDPWPQLRAAIVEPKNWSGALPASLPQTVTLATAKGKDTPSVLIDPSGTLTFRQRVLPLDEHLTKFGEATPLPQAMFHLDQVKLGAQPVTYTIVQDKFAPGQFETLSDADKLSRPSFEYRDAGFTVGGDRVALGTQFGVDVVFNDIYVGSEGPRPAVRKYLPLLAAQLAGALRVGARSRFLTAGTSKYAPPAGAAKLASLGRENFVVAGVDDMRPRANITPPVTKGEAHAALLAHLVANPAEEGKLQVVPVHELAA